MKKKTLSLIIITILSLFTLVSCSTEPDSVDTSANVDLIFEELQTKAEALFTEAINVLYNADYSLASDKATAESFINANFIEGVKSTMIDNLNDYNSKISTSDFAITFVEDVTPADSNYNKVFKIRYNITVSIDKPTIYQDLYATVVVTDSNNILIESLYEYNF